MTCVKISKLLGVVIFLKINHPKQLLMGSYLMEITTPLTINKKVYFSKNLYNSTSTTHVQEIHCDLKCVLSVFKCVLQVCSKCVLQVYSSVFISCSYCPCTLKALMQNIYVFMLFNLQFYSILHILFGVIQKKSFIIKA